MNIKSEAIRIASENSGVVGLKLRSGETVISTLEDKDESASGMDRPWTLLHPFLVYSDGRQSGMFPWLPTTADHPAHLANLAGEVVVAFAPADNLLEGYLKATGQKRILTAAPPHRQLIV